MKKTVLTFVLVIVILLVFGAATLCLASSHAGHGRAVSSGCGIRRYYSHSHSACCAGTCLGNNAHSCGQNFVDADNDGICDNCRSSAGQLLTDLGGDGICDSCPYDLCR